MRDKIIKTSFFTGVLLMLFSFTNTSEENFSGTYGVSENDPVIIELILNENKTFTYKDFSNSTQKIDVKGDWEVENNQVVLKNYDTKNSIHSKWKIVKDGMVAKSRKGLTFYTLVKK